MHGIRRALWYLWVSVAFAAGTARVHADAPLVYAAIEPAQITLGESATLTITNLGDGSAPIPLPTVSGLQFEIVGHRRQMEMTGGTVLMSTATVVRVTPQIAGTFTIPAVTPNSQPMVLQVNADHGPAGSNNNPANSNYMIRPPIMPTPQKIAGVRMTADGSAFVKLNIPKRTVYVGESVPIDIQVGMRAGFVTSLNGLPTLTGGEFTLNNLSRQPERQETTIDNKHFVILTWHSILAAIKPGAFAIGVDTPLTVRISTRAKQDSALDDLLGDPFLQNFYGSSVPRDITVSSGQSDLTVLALPAEGRPENFTGAVGEFKIATDLSGTHGALGEPLTLKMHITGTGNFDRVDTQMLSHAEDWKSYPPKPSFTPADAVGFKGEKVFEQPIIATKPGPQTLPTLAFSYFDPIARRYETARAAPLDVDISGSAAPLAASTNLLRDLDSLRRDHKAGDSALALASASATLVPPYLQPRFLLVPSIMVLGLAAFMLLTRRAEGRPRAMGALGPAEAACRSGDAGRFFEIARQLLQQRLAARWQLPPAAVTPAEVTARLGSEGADIRDILAGADEQRYAGGATPRADLAVYLDKLRAALKAL
jgi:hypothetical protein